MIKVCTIKGRRRAHGECWSFPNSKLSAAIAFARIGSQHGLPRSVTVCGRLARVYAQGVKGRGGRSMTELRRRARDC